MRPGPVSDLKTRGNPGASRALEQKIAYYLNFTDVIRILRLIDETPFEELQLDLGDLKLYLVQDSKQNRLPAPNAVVPALAHAPLPEPLREQVFAATTAQTSAAVQGTPVIAPLAGTFYRAPYPGEPPYVEVGAAVKQGDVLGLIEIMKLMNHVVAPCPGVIVTICAKNEELVEVGQLLAVIDPERAA